MRPVCPNVHIGENHGRIASDNIPRLEAVHEGERILLADVRVGRSVAGIANELRLRPLDKWRFSGKLRCSFVRNRIGKRKDEPAGDFVFGGAQIRIILRAIRHGFRLSEKLRIRPLPNIFEGHAVRRDKWLEAKSMQSTESTKQSSDRAIATQYCKINLAVGKFRIGCGPRGNKSGSERAIERGAN